MLRGKVYKVVSVWRYGWSESFSTVLPSTVYKYAVATFCKYPHKRLIIHFIQPHYPYLTLKFQDKSLEQLRKIVLKGYRNVYRMFHISKSCGNFLKKLVAIYGTPIYIDLDTQFHIKGYKQNLSLVMNYVEKLIKVFPGKIVITADHGEAFGEKIHPMLPFRVYGHIPGIRIPALIYVPWLEIYGKGSIEKAKKELVKLKVPKIR